MAKRGTTSGIDEHRQSGSALSVQDKIRLGLSIPVDVYTQEPLATEQDSLDGLSTIFVDYKPDLMDGPTSARIAVVDYDAQTGRQIPPARWDARNRRFVFDHKGKPEPITREHCAHPQFRQVNVWAFIQSALDSFEGTTVLGRSVPWAFEGNRLIVVPHAGYLANAFYDRRSKAIRFYYFQSDDKWIYTCLSHDIILHETAHAILDGLRPLYREDSSLQTAAFHEFMADLTTLIFSLYNSNLGWLGILQDPAESWSPIEASLAEEFGVYASGRLSLRSALNTLTVGDVKDSRSAYGWSDVLTGAMWDIYAGMVAQYLQKDLRAGRQPTYKEALSWALNRFRCTALPPLDYLPSVDVQLADYARAVLRASEVADPVDKDGYRPHMRKIFDQRGIDHAEEEEQPRFVVNDIDRVSRSRTDAYHFLHESRRQLCIPAEQDIAVVDLYETDKVFSNGRRLPREVVLQYAWREDVDLEGAGFGPLAGERVSLLCGGTLVLDGRGNLLSCMRKPGTGKQESNRSRMRRHCDQERARGEQRRRALLDYIKGHVARGHLALVERDGQGEILTESSVMAIRMEDGTLQLRATPGLHHSAED